MRGDDLAELLISEPVEQFHSDREFAMLLDQIATLGLYWHCEADHFGNGSGYTCTLRPSKPGRMTGAEWRRSAPRAWGRGITPAHATSQALGYAIEHRIYRWSNE